MLKSFTRDAATSSWVLRGFDAQRFTSAPPDFRVFIKTAVSVVTCKQQLTFIPFNGFSLKNLSLISLRTGMFSSAHSILNFPVGANFILLISHFMLNKRNLSLVNPLYLSLPM